ncbi:TIGR03545 family protein [Aliiglaciecola sp. CAU 1673]|uniref:TIGR03545 family protein n=1 Tax=Aliiglaciecola sp. CAU 1673 TaxID=3032595 RepID=UPI0023DC1BD7|nr:TIGR03545 family protein [Aliiglaciecola sp. CAU 1673]MDF2178982.1 TIGR03545 family protein [Aliiglaciecola sp. CAU 1673]
MNRWIRVKGLIAFVIIVGLLVAATLIFRDQWIKMAVEEGGAIAHGAEVNVDSVTSTLSPFHVKLHGVQITDPAKPTHNKLTAEVVSADVELRPLFNKKLIVDKLVATGLKFDQPRARPGKVLREPAPSNLPDLSTLLPDLSALPSVDEMLASSPLKTDKAVEQVKSAYQKHQANLKQQYEALPNKESIEAYKAKIEELKNTDFQNPADLAKAKERFDALKEELKQEKAKIVSFKEAVTSAKQELGEGLAELKAAPGQDYDLLKSLVGGDVESIKSVSQAMFGPKINAWADRLFAAYDMLAPALEATQEEVVENSGPGRYIEFTDTQPLPMLLVREAEISLSWQEYALNSLWQNITTEHERIGKATTFVLDAPQNPLWQSLKVDGDLWLAEDGFKGGQRWNLAGIKLADMPLMNSEKLKGQLQQAVLGSSGQLKIAANQLDGQGQIQMADLKILAEGQNKLTRILADSLNQLTSLNLKTGIGGSLEAPDFSIRSDLDKQLGGALLAGLGGEAKGKLDELKSRLNDKISGTLGEQNANLEQWLKWDELAAGNLGSVEDMLNAQLKGAIDKEKDKLKDKLKGKLFGN